MGKLDNTQLIKTGYCEFCRKQVKVFKIHSLHYPYWEYRCLVCNPGLIDYA